MGSRFHPLWWPVFGLASPGLVPWLAFRTRHFQAQVRQASQENARRREAAGPLALPALEQLDLTVLVDHQALPGFLGAPAVSYLFRTERGRLLMDVGFGPEHPSLAHNAGKLGISADGLDALFITHMHLDHAGGMAAQKARSVAVIEALCPERPVPCFLPVPARAPGFEPVVVTGPRLLPAGLGTTGPLARCLFFFGWMEEQPLVARLAGKGLVVVTGCGHPTIQVILDAVRAVSDEPVYAVVGGLHYPITRSRSHRYGIDIQRLFGTGKPPHQVLDDTDLDQAIGAINAAGPEIVLLSAHDSCDYAIERFRVGIDAQVHVLAAGETHQLG